MATISKQKVHASNPRYPVPQHVFIGVEHPFKIVNPFKAVDSLGGEDKISKLVKARESESFETRLSLHPGRYQMNNIPSANASTKSLVCQVTIPKIIGRKRKRKDGENEGEIEPHGLSEQQKLTMSLKDHRSYCQFRCLGEFSRVHKFRTMPDFVFSTQRNQFMQKFNSTIACLDYEQSKLFKLDENEEFGADTDIIPPPLFSPYTIPFNYNYQQNVAVKVVVGDDGGVETLNEGAPRRSLIPRVPFDIDQVPTGPPSDIPSLEAQSDIARDLVNKLLILFAERPIWTRRAIYHHLRENRMLGYLKWLLEYIGYEFETGPWASTVIRYGCDPRSDPKFRIYQSIMLHFDDSARNQSLSVRPRRGGARTTTKSIERYDQNGVPGYIFTGSTLVLDGKTWQVCDIQDPLMSAILSTPNLRSECDKELYGWFKNGTWIKAKLILRYKVRALMQQDFAWSEQDFVHACQMPDEFDPNSKDLPIDTTGWSREAIMLAFHMKQTAQVFGRNKGQLGTHDVSTAVINALRQHGGERTGDAADLNETFEQLLEEEENLLDEDSRSLSPDDSDGILDGDDMEEMDEDDQ